MVVRTDADGNVLDYDVVDQPTRSVTIDDHSSSLRQSSRMRRSETYDDEDGEPRGEEDEQNYEDERNRSMSRDSGKRSRRESTARVID